MKHTPTPWVLDRHSVIRGGPFRQYVKGPAQDQLAMFTGSNNMDPEEVTANAEFVVRAVNTHDGLLAIAETIGNECSICRSRHGSEVQHACE